MNREFIQDDECWICYHTPTTTQMDWTCFCQTCSCAITDKDTLPINVELLIVFIPLIEHGYYELNSNKYIQEWSYDYLIYIQQTIVYHINI